jgi:3-phenylpropionate/cinnamic acid dioxygenase small subunit
MKKSKVSISKRMKILEKLIDVDGFDELIEYFIIDCSFELARYRQAEEHKKAKRLEKKIIKFLEKVKISRKLYLGEI